MARDCFAWCIADCARPAMTDLIELSNTPPTIVNSGGNLNSCRIRGELRRERRPRMFDDPTPEFRFRRHVHGTVQVNMALHFGKLKCDASYDNGLPAHPLIPRRKIYCLIFQQIGLGLRKSSMVLLSLSPAIAGVPQSMRCCNSVADFRHC